MQPDLGGTETCGQGLLWGFWPGREPPAPNSTSTSSHCSLCLKDVDFSSSVPGHQRREGGERGVTVLIPADSTWRAFPGSPPLSYLSPLFPMLWGSWRLGTSQHLNCVWDSPRHLLNQLLPTSPQLCLFFLQPLFQPRVCIKEEFGRNTTLVTSFPFRFHGGRVWSKWAPD